MDAKIHVSSSLKQTRLKVLGFGSAMVLPHAQATPIPLALKPLLSQCCYAWHYDSISAAPTKLSYGRSLSTYKNHHF
eukprot:2799451-Rhodomonas_salina.4